MNRLPNVFLAAPATRRVFDGTVRIPVSLAAGGGAMIEVDHEHGVIRNVAVITAGVARPANWYPFLVDATTMGGVVGAINNVEAPLPVRFGHPELDGADSVAFLVGSIANARIDGNCVRADITLGSFAKHSPQGNLWDYLLSIADSQPSYIGMSVAISGGYLDEPGADGFPPARIDSLAAVDFVGKPGGNPNGLLSSSARTGPAAASPAHSSTPAAEGTKNMNKQQKAYLARLGLAEGVDDAATAAFIAALSAPNQAEFAALSGTDDSTAPASGAAPGASIAPGALTLAASATIAIAQSARRGEITDLAVLGNKPATWISDQYASGAPVSEIRNAMLRERAQARPAVGANIQVGDNREHVALRTSMREVMAMRAGCKVEKPHELAQKMRHLSVVDLGRRFLSASGLPDAMELAPVRVAMLCLNRNALHGALLGLGDYGGALGTFTGVLGDTANRSLLDGFTNYQRKWLAFARDVKVKDFRQVDRAGLGFTPMVITARGYDVAYAAAGDKREVYTLAKYTSGTAFAFEDFVNDDLDGIGKIPSNLGFVAAQTEDYLAFQVLIANAAMQDTIALFHSSHANLAGAAAAISVASYGLMRAAMMAQTEAGGNRALNLTPNVVLVPSSKAAIARQVFWGQSDPVSQGTALNPWVGDRITVVDSAELEGSSAISWYAGVSPDRPGCSLEVAHLEGMEQPFIDSEGDFDSDMVRFKVRHVAAAAAIDHRGIAKNAGA